jgi:hypothetical protein
MISPQEPKTIKDMSQKTVTFSIENDEEDNGWVDVRIIIVSDSVKNKIGIYCNLKDLKRFAQNIIAGDEGTILKGSRTGDGYFNLRLMGGKIEVESNPGDPCFVEISFDNGLLIDFATHILENY